MSDVLVLECHGRRHDFQKVQWNLLKCIPLTQFVPPPPEPGGALDFGSMYFGSGSRFGSVLSMISYAYEKRRRNSEKERRKTLLFYTKFLRM